MFPVNIATPVPIAAAHLFVFLLLLFLRHRSTISVRHLTYSVAYFVEDGGYHHVHGVFYLSGLSGESLNYYSFFRLL